MRCKINVLCLSVKWPFLRYVNQHRPNTRILEITYCTLISALLMNFPAYTKASEFVLVPIGNLKCNYPSFQSASGARHLHLPPCLSSLCVSLFLAGFVCWWRIVYFPPPYIFLSTAPTITYVNESSNQLSATKCAPRRRSSAKRWRVHDWACSRYEL